MSDGDLDLLAINTIRTLSIDAVQAAIVVLEDSPHFNAGKGAVFTHDGRNELDSSLMDGATLLDWKVLAKDGADLPSQVVRPATLWLSPGETYDVEVAPRLRTSIRGPLPSWPL